MSEKGDSRFPRIPGPGGPGRMPGTVQVEHAEHVGGTLIRAAACFARERNTLGGMLCAVVLGTLCGLWVPSLQSAAIDIISGEREGALLSLATVVLTVFATKFLSKKVRRSSRQRQELLGQLNSQAEEMIAGYRTVTAYNRQEAAAAEFVRLSDDMTRAGIRTDAVSGIMGPLSNCIGNIGFVIIAAVGGYFSVHGMVSVGVISAFIVYARQFSRPINELAQIYGQLQTAIAGAERVFHVLDEKSEDPSGEALEESGSWWRPSPGS